MAKSPATCTTKSDTICLAVALLLALASDCNGKAVVHSNATIFHGLQTTVSKTTLWKFLGIRYAEAPTGFQRFQRPRAPTLPATVDATRYGARCPASPLEDDMSEDCLFLNVFSPQLHSNKRLPVFVWIHGGGFVMGSANTVEADVLAAEGGIIVVTLNYRLGPLGFLAMEDQSSALGNYGLWDQRMALMWVKNYIRDFGGDETSVTVGGMSAGAASASMLSLSPTSRDLFKGVVQLSGSALSPWARVSHDYALQAARSLAFNVGCLTSETDDTVQTAAIVGCLRIKTLADLVAASTKIWKDSASALVEYVWVPVTDGEIVVNVTSAQPFQGPLLAGLVNNEGGLLPAYGVRRVSKQFPDVESQLQDRQFYLDHFLPALVRQAYGGASTSQAITLLHCAYADDDYEDADDDDLVKIRELHDVFGDQAFVYPSIEYLNQFSTYQPSYLYYMDHEPDRPQVEVEGIRHADDQAYLMAFMPTASKQAGFPLNVSRKDLELSRDLRALVVNFVVTGDPNKPERPQSWPLWPPYTRADGDYMVMSNSPRIASHVRDDFINLWTEDVPMLLTSHNHTGRWSHCFTSSAGGRSVGVSEVWGLVLFFLLTRLVAFQSI